MTNQSVAFFDIGETLGSVEVLRESIIIRPRKYIPGLLSHLIENETVAQMGIISNTHRGDENDSKRRELTAQVISALGEADLIKYFHPNLIFLSSETGLRKASTMPFELAVGRAGRLVGVRPNQCFFIGENRAERKFASDAGMKACPPHPKLIGEHIDGRELKYVKIEIPPNKSIDEFRVAIQPLAIALLHISEDTRLVLGIGTLEAVERLRHAGFSVTIPPRQPDPRFSDLYLLREYSADRDEEKLSFTDSSIDRYLHKTNEGQYIALIGAESIDDYHVGEGHGHTLQLTPNPYLVEPFEMPSLFAESARNKLSQAEVADLGSVIDEETIRDIVDKYSGRDPSKPHITRNRHVRSPDMPFVTDALVADFEAMGGGQLIVSRHQFNMEGIDLHNVVAELPGGTDEIVMITAHLDSTAAGTFGSTYDPTLHDAPGADDDASGIAGVLCAAKLFCKIFRNISPQRTIRFCLFNAEEQGLIGSQYYATLQRSSSAKIVAVFQMDMIGYDAVLPSTFETHAGHAIADVQQKSIEISNTLYEVVDQLKGEGVVSLELPQLFPERDTQGSWLPDPASGRSDHASFQDCGYAACVTSGDFFPSHGLPSEGNPNYHRVTDTVISIEYAADITRAICGAAICYTHPSEECSDKQDDDSNYDSLSIHGQIREERDLKPITSAKVSIYDAMQSRLIAEAVTNNDGLFELDIELRTSTSIYFVITDDQKTLLYSTHGSPHSPRNQNYCVTIDVPVVKKRNLEGFANRASPLDFSINSRQFDAEFVRSLDPAVVLQEIRRIAFPNEVKESFFASGVSPETELLNARYTLCETELIETLKGLVTASGVSDSSDVIHEIDRILLFGDEGFATQEYLSPHFRITFQTSGSIAVDLDTSEQEVINPGTDPSEVLGVLHPIGDVPTYIRRIAFWLERSLLSYTSNPFSMRNPAANGRILVNINGSPFGGATPSGFFLGNNLDVDLICAVAVHELFHMVQYEYGGFGPWRGAVFEGGATFAEDTVADKMNRYLDEAGVNFNAGKGLLAEPNQSLFDSAARYKTSLFWRYLAEQRSELIDEPVIGVDTYRKVIETCSGGSYSTSDVRDAIRALPWDADFCEFSYLDSAGEYLSSSETTLGNFALACYLKDLGDNIPDTRFDFIEDEERIYIDEVIPGAPQIDKLVSVKIQGVADLLSNQSASFVGRVKPLGSLFYEVNIPSDVENILVQFVSEGSANFGFFQIILFEDDGSSVRDIIQSDKGGFQKTIAVLGESRLSKLALIVTGATEGGDFHISVTSEEPVSDVMITRWNSETQKEYHIDSRNWAWNWVSPDLWITPTAGLNNFDIHVRVHNKGNLEASNVAIDFEYLGNESNPGWHSVRSANDVVQRVDSAVVGAGETKEWDVPWKPRLGIQDGAYTIRAKITSPGDRNSDNKTAVSRMGMLSFENLTELKNCDHENRKYVLRENKEIDPKIRHEISRLCVFHRSELIGLSEDENLERLPPSLTKVASLTMRRNADNAEGFGRTFFGL